MIPTRMLLMASAAPVLMLICSMSMVPDVSLLRHPEHMQHMKYSGGPLVSRNTLPAAQHDAMTLQHYPDSSDADSMRIHHMVLAALDAIQDHDFLLETYIASGYEVVETVLASKESIRVLAAHPAVACPLLEERITRQGLMDESLVGYFSALGAAGCRDAVPLLARYLRKLSDSADTDGNALSWPWHPGLHAVHALRRLTDNEVQFDDQENPRIELLRMAGEAEAWYERWKGLPEK